MSASDHVAVPAKYRVRLHQQPHPTLHLPRQALEERRQERPFARMKLNRLPVQLPFQNADLVAQGKELDIFRTADHRQQS
ncbi:MULTISPECIES: hypothetical protein [unclassified Streptomyces]|uniref:hypothetical protein n=1 Tax=unclassified Streptomyces TaxID=2593676 RepID=UPI003BB6C090